MTYEGLGEMFEGAFADMCAGKFPLVSMGAEQRVSRVQTLERGPPSALAIFFIFIYGTLNMFTVRLFGWSDQNHYEWGSAGL